MTGEEVIGGLDGELDTAVAVFDGMILDERSKAEAIADAMAEPGDSTFEEDNEALFEEGDLNEGLPGYGEFPGGETVGTAPTETTEDTEGLPADAGATADNDGPSGPTSTRQGGMPDDIGDGSDDDIVARQIREAASKEKDPVLRDKLWDEYRKYKDQQRGS